MSEQTFDEFAKKTLERADRLKRAVAIKLFSSVIKGTPIGNPDLWKGSAPAGYVGGRLRANWNCSFSEADTSTTNGTAHSKAIPEMVEKILTGDRNTVDFLANSLPYAASIEYDGHSSQAPSGMVGLNVIRIKKIISNENRKLKT